MNILSILFAATAVAGRVVSEPTKQEIRDAYEKAADERARVTELLRDSIDTVRTEADKIRSRADDRIADKEAKIIELMEDRERVKVNLERSQEWREDAVAKRDAAIVKVRARIDSIINKAEEKIDEAADTAEELFEDAEPTAVDAQAQADAIREMIAERKAAADKVRSDLKAAIVVEMSEMKQAIEELREQLAEKKAEAKNDSRRLAGLTDPAQLAQMLMDKKTEVLGSVQDKIDSLVQDKMDFLGTKIQMPTVLQGQAFGDPIQKLQMAFDELKSKFNKFLSMEGLGF